jgi:hypothetical protein
MTGIRPDHFARYESHTEPAGRGTKGNHMKNLTTSQIEAAKKVGQAIAREVLADSEITMRWTGIEDQDGDQFTAAGIDPYENRAGWDEAIEAAHEAYDEAIVTKALRPGETGFDEAIIRRSLSDGHINVNQWGEETGLSVVDGCLMLSDMWYADDGNAELEFDCADGREAAEEYVEGGDWGNEGACIKVRVWRVGIDENGKDSLVEEDFHEIDVEPDTDSMIAAAGGDADCDHDWTAEGEGGLRENPGVWSTGGTAMVFHTHCTKCGLHRKEYDTGSQRNPGEHDTVEFEQPKSWCVKCQSEECECTNGGN